jgi:hypothetical protein
MPMGQERCRGSTTGLHCARPIQCTMGHPRGHRTEGGMPTDICRRPLGAPRLRQRCVHSAPCRDTRRHGRVLIETTSSRPRCWHTVTFPPAAGSAAKALMAQLLIRRREGRTLESVSPGNSPGRASGRCLVIDPGAITPYPPGARREYAPRLVIVLAASAPRGRSCLNHVADAPPRHPLDVLMVGRDTIPRHPPRATAPT